MSLTGRAAEAYVSRLDLAVIPTGPDCKPGSVKKFGALLEAAKEPKDRVFSVKDATKDVELIRAIWTRTPKANVSIVTGAVSGVFALDIDAKGKVNGFEALARLEAMFGPLPSTWRALTPSGGEHRYFVQPSRWVLRNKVGLRIYDRRGRVSELFDGLDIRTDGGACAAPPSEKTSGTYRWADHPLSTPVSEAPEWLLKLAIDPPPPPKVDRPPLRRGHADKLARYIDRAIDSECARVTGTKSGRNVQLFKSAANLGSLVGANVLPQDLAEAELWKAATDCGLVADDGAHSVRATIASGMRKGMQNPREVTA
ncbi:bifunctional DNA primase/polymerase [Phenylobacterium kunshanense]|uniref:DNA primase/polymerase bifunctional N-terminal domain-containing protein n=1 Tax=Phenylobacterium kunshanense TaxID=1445034 RepID=A0A328BSH4_9CAUL|nr:bifunctional DNA primase/polymerase [Phenylobacterium kunshanense]RAK68794.1 hypothetical protein DJ019_01925 [Phenylobacterium kunshanense]